MAQLPTRRVRARVTMTLGGTPSNAAGEDVRIALSRGTHAEGTRDDATLVAVEDVEILDEQAPARPGWPGRTSFYDSHDLAVLVEEQDVTPAKDFESLLGDIWPEDETADDFIAAVRARRHDDG